MGKLIQGYWDCRYCETKKISGLETKCPCCKKTRDEGTVFYMDETSPYIDEKIAKNINKNPDWLCQYCGSLNNDSYTECYNCGSEKIKGTETYFENKEKREKRRQEAKATMSETPPAPQPISIPAPPPPKPKKKKKFLTIGIIALASILLITGLIFLFTPKTVEGSVESFSWERTIDIEELKTFDESDWTLPSGARLKYSQTEIASYKQVLDHYETKEVQKSREVLDHYETYVAGYRDLGNGTFEEITEQRPVYKTEYYTETVKEPVYRDEPVYATKYYYEIDRWTSTREVKTSNNDKEPFWGEVKLKVKEREGNKTEKYYITVSSDGKTDKYTVEFELWNRLNAGDKVKLKVNIFGEAKLDE